METQCRVPCSDPRKSAYARALAPTRGSEHARSRIRAQSRRRLAHFSAACRITASTEPNLLTGLTLEQRIALRFQLGKLRALLLAEHFLAHPLVQSRQPLIVQP